MPITRSRGKSGDFLRHPAHHVERVRDDHDDRLGRHLLDLQGDLLHDLGVGAHQVVPAHPGLRAIPAVTMNRSLPFAGP